MRSTKAPTRRCRIKAVRALPARRLRCALARGFRTSETPYRPGAEAEGQPKADRERRQRQLGLPGDEAPARLEERRDRVHGRNAVDPPLQEAERHVDRRE